MPRVMRRGAAYTVFAPADGSGAKPLGGPTRTAAVGPQKLAWCLRSCPRVQTSSAIWPRGNPADRPHHFLI